MSIEEDLMIELQHRTIEELQAENEELKNHIREILTILQKHHTESVLEAAAYI